MRRTLVITLVAATAAACGLSGCGERKQQQAAKPPVVEATRGAESLEITPEEAKRKLESGQAVLVDVREPWEVQTASVAGAKVIHIPMGEIQARQQELDPEANILVMCHHGVRSLKVTNWLREHGYEKAQSVKGGIDAWARRVDPKVPVY